MSHDYDVLLLGSYFCDLIFTGLPAFTTVRGGAYFFLPGIRALRWLSDPGA